MDAVEVWGNAVPYLTSVDSPEGDEVPNYHSTVTVPLDEFKSKLLAQYPQADLSGEPAGWFANLVPNSAGGVETVDIGGTTVGGGSLRTLFGLRSTSFTVSASADGVTFSVTGYGHGVGLSQWGAKDAGRAGLDLRSHPYPLFPGDAALPMTQKQGGQHCRPPVSFILGKLSPRSQLHIPFFVSVSVTASASLSTASATASSVS